MRNARSKSRGSSQRPAHRSHDALPLGSEAHCQYGHELCRRECLVALFGEERRRSAAARRDGAFILQLGLDLLNTSAEEFDGLIVVLRALVDGATTTSVA